MRCLVLTQIATHLLPSRRDAQTVYTQAIAYRKGHLAVSLNGDTARQVVILIMKALSNCFTPILILHVSATLGLLFEPSLPTLPKLATIKARLQRPIMNIPNIVLPPFINHDKDSSSEGGNGNSQEDGVVLSDVIGKQRAINIFASFTRDIEAISRRLDDGAQNTTVLAPLNSQIEQLPRKPWQDPRDYEALGENAYEGQSGEDRAQRNLRRFVEAHIVPLSPWKEGEKVKSLGGGEVWWEEKEGQKLVSMRVQQGKELF